ncbi:MAG TPA: cytochrome c oxidase subunit II [Opitutaceae bacterium]|nr:cytochrome c oxidase subunit II [Opitutaceae bacterium]
MSTPAAFLALEQASTVAGKVDLIGGTLLAVSLVVVAGLLAVNLYFIVRYRRGSPAPRPPLQISPGKLEAAWTTGTTLVFLGFFFWGAQLFVRMERPPPGATTIDVAARQWMWDFRQPNGRREFDTLHVPVGVPVRLRMTSEDVIHSFYAPSLRVKQDVVPGKTVSLWFQVTKAGTFTLFCSEFCGSKHAAMVGQIVAEPADRYAAWLAAGNPGSIARRGPALFVRYGCAGCHSPGGSVRAPPLERVYGSEVPVAGGGFVHADEAYLTDSILLPEKVVVAGYQPLMPSFQGVIPPGDLVELVAYLKTLGSASPPPARP